MVVTILSYLSLSSSIPQFLKRFANPYSSAPGDHWQRLLNAKKRFKAILRITQKILKIRNLFKFAFRWLTSDSSQIFNCGDDGLHHSIASTGRFSLFCSASSDLQPSNVLSDQNLWIDTWIIFWVKFPMFVRNEKRFKNVFYRPIVWQTYPHVLAVVLSYNHRLFNWYPVPVSQTQPSYLSLCHTLL